MRRSAEFHGIAEFAKSIQTGLGQDAQKQTAKNTADIKTTLNKVDGQMQEP